MYQAMENGRFYHYLGGENVAGGKIKEAGNTNWLIPNIDATNISLFTALPAGYRNNTGVYDRLRDIADFWSISPYNGSLTWFRAVNYNNSIFARSRYAIGVGLSIRCIKD